MQKVQSQSSTKHFCKYVARNANAVLRVFPTSNRKLLDANISYKCTTAVLTLFHLILLHWSTVHTQPFVAQLKQAFLTRRQYPVCGCAALKVPHTNQLKWIFSHQNMIKVEGCVECVNSLSTCYLVVNFLREIKELLSEFYGCGFNDS